MGMVDHADEIAEAKMMFGFLWLTLMSLFLFVGGWWMHGWTVAVCAVFGAMAALKKIDEDEQTAEDDAQKKAEQITDKAADDAKSIEDKAAANKAKAEGDAEEAGKKAAEAAEQAKD